MSNPSVSGSEQEVDATPFHPKQNGKESNKGTHRIIEMDVKSMHLSISKKCSVNVLLFEHRHGVILDPLYNIFYFSSNKNIYRQG